MRDNEPSASSRSRSLLTPWWFRPATQRTESGMMQQRRRSLPEDRNENADDVRRLLADSIDDEEPGSLCPNNWKAWQPMIFLGCVHQDGLSRMGLGTLILRVASVAERLVPWSPRCVFIGIGSTGLPLLVWASISISSGEQSRLDSGHAATSTFTITRMMAAWVHLNYTISLRGEQLDSAYEQAKRINQQLGKLLIT